MYKAFALSAIACVTQAISLRSKAHTPNPFSPSGELINPEFTNSFSDALLKIVDLATLTLDDDGNYPVQTIKSGAKLVLRIAEPTGKVIEVDTDALGDRLVCVTTVNASTGEKRFEVEEANPHGSGILLLNVKDEATQEVEEVREVPIEVEVEDDPV